MPVTVVGEFFERRVLEIADAEAEDGEEDSALAAALDQLHEVARAGDANVEIAVGAEDDAVEPARDEVPGGDVVGHLDPAAAVGRAAGVDRLDRGANALALIAWRRVEHQAGVAGVGTDGN